MQTKQKLEKQDFKKVISNLLCKSLLICIGMMFFYQFAGYAMVISFAGDILQKDEEILDKNGTSPRYVSCICIEPKYVAPSSERLCLKNHETFSFCYLQCGIFALFGSGITFSMPCCFSWINWCYTWNNSSPHEF